MGNICESRANFNQNLQTKTNVPSQLVQYKWYNFAIYVDIGDIKQEEVDVIACKTDLNLDILQQTANSLGEKAMSQLNKDLALLKDKQNYTFGDVVYTYAAELDFDYMFFCILPGESDPHLQQLIKSSNGKYQKQYIYDCIIKCMRLGKELAINSISFPYLGSLNVSVNQTATMMVLALKYYIEENRFHLKENFNTVRFCLDDESQKEQFIWAFNQVFLNSDNISDSMSDKADSDEQNNWQKQSPTKLEMVQRYADNEEDDFLSHFGMSYQEKMQGSADRKGSL